MTHAKIPISHERGKNVKKHIRAGM